MIEYLKNEEIKKLFEGAEVYQKKDLTGLRKPNREEIGKILVTYVKDNNQIRKESEAIIENNKLIARNPGFIGKNKNNEEIFNEWTIEISTAVKNYGQEVVDSLTEEFSFHKKQNKIKAILLTQQIMDLLGANGDILKIKVSWSDQPMLAKLGDYLTNGEYSISAHDINGYEKINYCKIKAR